MRKTILLPVAIGTTLLIGLAFFYAQPVYANEVDIDEIEQFPVQYSAKTGLYKVRITWKTDVTTSGKIQYGTTSGVYTIEEEADDNGDEYVVTLSDLAPSTKYYYRIVATDDDGNSESTRERIVQTYGSEHYVGITRVVYRGHSKVVIQTWSNMGGIHTVRYGTSADNLDKTATYTSGKRDVSSPYNYGYHIASNLQPSTIYYFQATAVKTVYNNPVDESDTTLYTGTSSVAAAKTAGKPKITSVSPTTLRKGTTVTITGQNFGAYKIVSHEDWFAGVSFPCTGKTKAGPANDLLIPSSRCNATIVSWTNSKIVAKLDSGTPVLGSRIYVSSKFGVPFKIVDPYTIKSAVLN